MNIQGKIDELNDLIRRIDSIPEVIHETVEEYQDDLLQLNKDQMLLGRDTDGHEYKPGYSDDPYFKTEAHRDYYIRRKDRLLSRHNARVEHFINYPEKDRDTPNLIVRGDFQDGMFINVSSRSFSIDSRYEDSKDIENKYSNRVFGLAPLSKEYFWKNFLFDVLNGWLWGADAAR